MESYNLSNNLILPRRGNNNRNPDTSKLYFAHTNTGGSVKKGNNKSIKIYYCVEEVHIKPNYEKWNQQQNGKRQSNTINYNIKDTNNTTTIDHSKHVNVNAAVNFQFSD